MQVRFLLSDNESVCTNIPQQMKLTNYFSESYNELINKVSWPTWSELRNSAIVVMVASFIIALLIFVIDSSFRGLMKLIYSFFY